MISRGVRETLKVNGIRVNELKVASEYETAERQLTKCKSEVWSGVD